MSKQVRTIYFDTETTGILNKKKSPDEWPRIVLLAWIVSNEEGLIFEQANFIVKPEGFIIPQAAIDIHGITNEIAKKSPWTIKEVLLKFYNAWKDCGLMVCHNVDYDVPIVDGEAYRLSKTNAMPFHKKPSFCTMKQTADVVKLKKSNGNSNKWPKLLELCDFCKVKNEKEHEAGGDVMATYLCYQELIHRGLINPIPSTQGTIF